MEFTLYDMIALVFIAGIILGIHWMNSPKTAVRGNLIGALCLLGAVILTLTYNDILDVGILWVGLIIGTIAGYYMAVKVTMLKMPQMVALLNGFGGGASAIASVIIITDNIGNSDLFSISTAFLALIVGWVTFSGSIIAAAKLDQKISQKPVILKRHSIIMAIITILTIIVSIIGIVQIYYGTAENYMGKSLFTLLVSIFSLALGIFFTIRVGGADMPITISLLNSLSGVAGAIAGFAIYEPLLIAVGGIVGAAGLILTQVMCRGMNRSLLHVLAGKTSASDSIISKEEYKEQIYDEKKEILTEKDMEDEDIKVRRIINEAEKVIIVPGYGMALSQAQHEVKNMYDSLIAKGKDVKFAIHPVAGRMPGHMNVLLAEADVPYDKLFELELINDEFSITDLAIVIGANDVINPAANDAEDTPIYGMPILSAHEAKYVIICNYDTKPGYSGVPNPIYNLENVILKIGDAKETIVSLVQQLAKLES
jgi:NAD(P) transhydrogenase subunit beta